jgi:hypothetical protein
MRVRTGRFTTAEHAINLGVALRLHPKGSDTDQPLLLQPRGTHSDLCGQRARQMPVAASADGSQDGGTPVHAQRQQVMHFGARPAPLLPVAHAHASAQPLVQFRDRGVSDCEMPK